MPCSLASRVDVTASARQISAHPLKNSSPNRGPMPVFPLLKSRYVSLALITYHWQQSMLDEWMDICSRPCSHRAFNERAHGFIRDFLDLPPRPASNKNNVMRL